MLFFGRNSIDKTVRCHRVDAKRKILIPSRVIIERGDARGKARCIILPHHGINTAKEHIFVIHILDIIERVFVIKIGRIFAQILPHPVRGIEEKAHIQAADNSFQVRVMPQGNFQVVVHLLVGTAGIGNLDRVDIEDLIAEEQCVYTLTEAGYIKRQLKATYQAQKRGGRGISGMTRKEEDIVQEMFVGSTHDYVLFVTDRGRLFRIKGYTIAEGSRTSKGTNIVNLLQLAEGEKVTNMICQSKDAEQSGGYVTMVTKQGLIKRTPLEQYANIRKTGLIGIALNEGDALAWTRLTTGHDMLIVATRNGQAIRFNEEDARPMGRSGHGVRAIKLAEGDEVVGVCICREGGTVLTVTENGKGRRSDIDTYRITARGGKGIRNYDAAKDKVAAVKIVDDVDDVLLSSQEGIIIRLHANEIPLQSRYGSGVRVMRLGENDKVMVLARTDHDDEAQTEQIDASDADAEPTAEQLAEMEAADAAAEAEAPEAEEKTEE